MNIGQLMCKKSEKFANITTNQPMFTSEEILMVICGKLFYHNNDVEFIASEIKKLGPKRFAEIYNGVYVILFYDIVNKKISVIVDKIGTICLYYYEGKDWIVSWNLCDFSPQEFTIDSQRVEAYFTNYHNEPPIKNVERLKGGEILHISERGMEIESYYDHRAEILKVIENPQRITRREAKDQVHDMLSSNLSNICNGSLHTSLLLSGGLDSSVIHLLLDQLNISHDSYYLNTPKHFGKNYIPTANNLKVIDREVSADWIYERNLTEPCQDTATLLTFMAEPAFQAQKDGTDLIITGEYGDITFLHRMKYWLPLVLTKYAHEDEIVHIRDMYSNKWFKTFERHETANVHVFLKKRFAYYFKGNNHSYSIFDEKKLNHFLSKFYFYHKGNLASYYSNVFFTESQDIYRSSNLPTFCPFVDADMMKFILSLPVDILEEQAINASLLDDIIKDLEPGRKYVNQQQSDEHSWAWSHGFCTSEKLRVDLEYAISLLYEMGITNADYFEKRYLNDHKRISGDQFRLLAFGLWHKNWQSNRFQNG